MNGSTARPTFCGPFVTRQLQVPATASAAMSSKTAAYKLPVGRPDERDPQSLDEHPLLQRLMPGLGTDAENEELRDSLMGRQYKRVIITGTGCAETPPDTVLDGRRLRRAALAVGLPVMVEIIDNLSYAQQIEIVVHSNLAAGMARRYDERRKAELERAVLETLGDRQGLRTDLEPPSARKEVGETPEIVVQRIKELHPDGYDGLTSRGVRDRQRIFFDPVSPELLRDAVASGKIDRRPAADLIVKHRRDAADALKGSNLPYEKLAEHPAVVAARAGLFTEVQTLLRGGRPKPPPPPPKPPEKTEAWCTLVDGTMAIPNIMGCKMLVQIEGEKAHIVVLGPADADPNIYVATAPTTSLTWPTDVAAVVNELPAELRAGVTVNDPELLEPVRCPKCGESRFFVGGAGCVRCQAFRVGLIHNFEHPRTRVRIATPAGEIAIVEWHRESHVQPNGAHRDTPCLSIPQTSLIYLSGQAPEQPPAPAREGTRRDHANAGLPAAPDDPGVGRTHPSARARTRRL